jgi:hypothetical protein
MNLAMQIVRKNMNLAMQIVRQNYEPDDANRKTKC